jgi:hypothetical protein
MINLTFEIYMIFLRRDIMTTLLVIMMIVLVLIQIMDMIICISILKIQKEKDDRLILSLEKALLELSKKV